MLQAVQEGKPIPEGADYQHGPQYGIDTLREAVFQRDGHKCVVCGRSIKEGAILHAHHMYFWRGQHGNRMSELVTCCEKCHAPKNHKQSGKLWGLDIGLNRFNGVVFMNSVKWYIYKNAKETHPEICVHMTYGAATKRSRNDLGLPKSHINDAYSMGEFRPAKRCEAEHFQKRRRNNRQLQKFYDASYIDMRDGKKKHGAELGCQRTNRREPRHSDKDLRRYRGKRVSKGHVSIRRKRYSIQSGDIVAYNGKEYVAGGCQHYGEYVKLGEKLSVKVTKVKVITRAGGWKKI